MKAEELQGMRVDFQGPQLGEEGVEQNPYTQFHKWFDEAIASGIAEVNAMVLATSNAAAVPSARVVLLKGVDEKGFVFFSNYESHKGQDLQENPRAELLWYWQPLARQIRISGSVEKLNFEESREYFHSRPIASQISAWTSKQSTRIPNREVLTSRFTELSEQWKDSEIPLPPNWGGYRVLAKEFEFWQGQNSRLHDRICYELVDGEWSIFRRSP